MLTNRMRAGYFLALVSAAALIGACSSGTGTGEEDAEGGEGGGASGAAGTAGRAPGGGGAGALSAGGSKAQGGAGSSDGDSGAGGQPGGSGAGGTTSGGGGKSGASGTGGTAGMAGASGKGGAAGLAGAAGKSGAAGVSGAGGIAGGAGKSGAAGSGGSAQVGGGAGQGGAGQGGAGQGGAGTAGQGGGGAGTGGGGGATCVPKAAIEVCFNGVDDDCSGAQDEGCPPLSLQGNWRWTFAFDNAPRRTTLALVGATNLTGTAIDEYGLATLTGTFDAATKQLSVKKVYEDTDTFFYTGTASFTPAGVTLAGTWEQQGGGAVTPFDGILQASRAVDTAAGAWAVDAYFDSAVSMTLAVSPEGYVTGTMSDTFGAATLLGLFDRGDGRLFVKKTYGSGTVYWWQGAVAASGLTIANGQIGAVPGKLDYGSWTGKR